MVQRLVALFGAPSIVVTSELHKYDRAYGSFFKGILMFQQYALSS